MARHCVSGQGAPSDKYRRHVAFAKQMKRSLRGLRLAAMVAISAAMPATAEPPKFEPSQDASALLEAAREHREVFHEDFPGCRSDLLIHVDGEAHRGSMLFKPPITLEVQLDNKELRKEVKRTIKSMLSHRMASNDSSRQKKPVAFGPEDHHPLGRKILIGDKYSSSYRIHDNQILEVDRQMDEKRLLISVLDTEKTTTGRYLSRHFFVTVFDRASGSVKSASAYTDAYQKLGNSYFPKSRRIVSAEKGKTRTLKIDWLDVQLLQGAE